MNQFEYPESDWKLFRKKFGEWQERYLDGRIAEYKKLLDPDDTSSDKFDLLQKRRKSSQLCYGCRWR